MAVFNVALDRYCKPALSRCRRPPCLRFGDSHFGALPTLGERRSAKPPLLLPRGLTRGQHRHTATQCRPSRLLLLRPMQRCCCRRRRLAGSTAAAAAAAATASPAVLCLLPCLHPPATDATLAQAGGHGRGDACGQNERTGRSSDEDSGAQARPQHTVHPFPGPSDQRLRVGQAAVPHVPGRPRGGERDLLATHVQGAGCCCWPRCCCCCWLWWWCCCFCCFFCCAAAGWPSASPPPTLRATPWPSRTTASAA